MICVSRLFRAFLFSLVLILFLVLFLVPPSRNDHRFCRKEEQLARKQLLEIDFPGMKESRSPDASMPFSAADLSAVQSLQNPYNKGYRLRRMAHIAFEYGRPDIAYDLAMQAKAIYQDLNQWKKTAQVHEEISGYLKNRAENETAGMTHLQMAYSIYEKNRDRRGIIRTLRNIAGIHFRRGEWSDCVQTFLRASSLDPHPQSPLPGAVTALYFSRIYQIVEEPELFFSSLKEAETVFRSEHIWEGMATVYDLLGEWHLDHGILSQARGYWEKARHIRKSQQVFPETSIDEFHFGLLHLRGGDRQQGGALLHRALLLADREGNRNVWIQCQIALAEWKWQNGNQVEAEEHLRQGIGRCNSPIYIRERLLLYQRLVSLYEQTGKYELAFPLALKRDQLQESSNSTRQRNDIAIWIERRKTEAAIEGMKKRYTIFLFITLVFLLFLSFLMLPVLKNIRNFREKARHYFSLQEQKLRRKESILENLRQQLKQLEPVDAAPKYQKSHLSPELAQAYMDSLIQIMKQEKPYLNSELTLKALGDQLNLNTSYLSQVLNERIGKSFTDFINSFRVEEAKRLLAASKLPVIDIGFEVGFNSKSCFYTNFKRSTGMHPSEYRKQRHTPDSPSQKAES